MGSNFIPFEDMAQIKSKLQADFDRIPLPETLDTEKMLQKIENIPQDPVIRPNFGRRLGAVAAGFVVVCAAAYAVWQQSPEGGLLARNKLQGNESAQLSIEMPSGEAEIAYSSAAMEDGAPIAPQENALTGDSVASKQSWDIQPNCVGKKQPLIPAQTEFSILDMFPQEGVQSIEIGSSGSEATAVYTGSTEVAKVLTLLDSVTLQNVSGPVNLQAESTAAKNNTAKLVIVYVDGTFFEVALMERLVVVNPAPNSGIAFVEVNPDAVAELVNKYKTDTGTASAAE